MKDGVSRRDFLGVASGVAAGTVWGGATLEGQTAPAVLTHRTSANAAVASANGLEAVTRTGALILEGRDTLDAAIEGVRIQELDPEDMSVGYGGLPNEEGVVQLDASCMHGPTHRAGAVAALENIKTPSEVARLVLEHTDHVLLVGEGAKRFALSFGFQEEDLLTPASRKRWLEWRANRGREDDWLDAESIELGPRLTGTINCNVVNSRGDLSSVTTTSGLAWKIPGRVGDSPLHGAGQYTDNDVGAAGATGRGEAAIKTCGAFLTVEHMRRGLSPTDAAIATLRRVVGTTEPRLLDERGRPRFQLKFYAVRKDGAFGSAALYGDYRGSTSRFAAFDGSDASLRDCGYLYEEYSE